MFEARLDQGVVLKRVVESIRDLVTEANLDCNPSGISLQSMDGAHVTLVMLQLRAEGFDKYRCDRSIPIGINMGSLAKIFKCGNTDDAITLKADDDGETISIVFDSPRGDKVSDYELKLMDLDIQHLGVPEDEYDVDIKMSSSEFQRICRDLSNISESVTLVATKDSIKFKANGEMGNGSIVLRQGSSVDNEAAGTKIIMRQPAILALSLKFLQMFTKATPLSETVHIGMTDSKPMMLEYPIGDIGYLRFYLAPKVGDDDEDMAGEESK